VRIARVSRMVLPGASVTVPVGPVDSEGVLETSFALHDSSGTTSPDALSTTSAGGWTQAATRHATSTDAGTVGIRTNEIRCMVAS
jgi:hypothetical protein